MVLPCGWISGIQQHAAMHFSLRACMQQSALAQKHQERGCAAHVYCTLLPRRYGSRCLTHHTRSGRPRKLSKRVQQLTVDSTDAQGKQLGVVLACHRSAPSDHRNGAVLAAAVCTGGVRQPLATYWPART